MDYVFFRPRKDINYQVNVCKRLCKNEIIWVSFAKEIRQLSTVRPLQHTETQLQHTATYCSTLQQTAINCTTLHHTATRCNTVQHTATHCNALQRTAAHDNTAAKQLQHTATHCNILQHNCNRFTFRCQNTLQHTATQLQQNCNTTATQCNVLQHNCNRFTFKSQKHCSTQ